MRGSRRVELTSTDLDASLCGPRGTSGNSMSRSYSISSENCAASATIDPCASTTTDPPSNTSSSCPPTWLTYPIPQPASATRSSNTPSRSAAPSDRVRRRVDVDDELRSPCPEIGDGPGREPEVLAYRDTRYVTPATSNASRSPVPGANQRSSSKTP